MKKFLALLALCSGTLLAVGSATAEEDASGAVEIDRDGAALSMALRRHDTDVFDTAVVATNRSERAALVLCTGHDDHGARVGRALMRVPANGLRFVLASDLADGTDFLGSIRCATRNHGVIGSSYLVGNGDIETLPVRNARHGDSKRFIVPVVLTR